MKITTFPILLILFYCLPATAQKQCLPIPDSLGKALSTVFFNKEDISKMPVFPDEKEMNIRNSIEGMEQAVEVGNENNASENDIIANWKRLLHLAQTKKITSANTTYLRSYFSKEQWKIDNRNTDTYTLYSVFRNGTENIAIRFGLLWLNNKWLLIKTDPDFYTYRQRTDERQSFRPKGWAESVRLPGKAPSFTAPLSQKKEAWTTTSGCMTEPSSFITEVMKNFSGSASIETSASLISAADFKTGYQPAIEQMIAGAAKQKGSMSASDLKELAEMQKSIKSNPNRLYQRFVTNDISQLQEYLTSVKFKPSMIKTTSYTISNYDFEVWAPGTIILKATVEIKTSNGDEGLQFYGTWFNNRWILLAAQATTYGITVAE